jgi:hypothetical protein
MVMQWNKPATLLSGRFTCGFCGWSVASTSGYETSFPAPPKNELHRIYLCPNCTKPTYFDGQSQVPGVAPGSGVAHLPGDIKALYRETRQAIAAGCPTASVLASRKLLMHVAVSKGATENISFLDYVNYLAEKGYVPPDGRGWVDHIRAKGNEANHEIVLMSSDDASELVTFAEMLLKFIYEFPKRVPPKPGKAMP